MSLCNLVLFQMADVGLRCGEFLGWKAGLRVSLTSTAKGSFPKLGIARSCQGDS
jgi:hypothetical protein